VIPLWVADMDFRSPPGVLEELEKRVKHGIFGYSVPPEELVDVVISVLQRDYGWEVEPEWIVWLPGLVTGLNVTCRAVGKDGDGVMTAVPVYPPFLTAPGFSHRTLVTVDLVRQEGRWIFDFDKLEKSITQRTRLFILCNPHNPVGRVFLRDELETLAAICEKRDMVVCSDEIHCGLVLDQDKKHIPFATLGPKILKRTITLLSPSKTFNLPGLGCSFALIQDKELRRSFQDATAGIVPHVSPLAFTAALSAYRDGYEWHQALLSYLSENRDTVERFIGETPGLSMSHVEGTYLAWIDTRAAALENPVKFFEDAGVGLFEGAAFGGPGFVRLNFGCPRVTLAEALRRMGKAMGRLQDQR